MLNYKNSSIDNEQLSKAKLKIKATIDLINALYNINKVAKNDGGYFNLEDEEISTNEVKDYLVKLNYQSYDNYYKFFISIYKGKSDPERTCYLKFSLKDLKKGLNLFGSIIEEFSNKDILYTSFSNTDKPNIYKNFSIHTKHNFDLCIDIKTPQEQLSLEKFKTKIDEKNNKHFINTKKKI